MSNSGPYPARRMNADPLRIDWTSPGFRELLAALGLSIVDSERRAVFEPSPGSPVGAEVAAVGWATVELDRAEAELGSRLATTFEEAPRDALLGATVRRSLGAEPLILLLEPDTEGRLSGGLARHGEGPIAVYLRLDAGASTALLAGLKTRAGTGPFGPERVVLSGSPWGPFLLFVENSPPDEPDRVPSGP